MSSPVPDRLHAALRAALKARDAATVSALRSALAAIANAEALPVPATQAGRSSQYLAGSIAALGVAEASRRVLTDADIAAIVSAEIAERRAAAVRYEQAGHPDRADRLRREASALASVLSGDSTATSGC